MFVQGRPHLQSVGDAPLPINYVISPSPRAPKMCRRARAIKQSTPSYDPATKTFPFRAPTPPPPHPGMVTSVLYAWTEGREKNKPRKAMSHESHQRPKTVPSRSRPQPPSLLRVMCRLCVTRARRRRASQDVKEKSTAPKRSETLSRRSRRGCGLAS